MGTIPQDLCDFEFMVNITIVGRAAELVVELNARKEAQQETSILLTDNLPR